VRASLLLLPVLLLALVAASASFHQTPARAQNQASLQYPLSMGFGPGIMTPVSQGVPVYTPGDQIWVASDSQDQLTATLATPGGTTAARAILTPMDPVFLYALPSSGPAGSWTLTVTSSAQPLVGEQTTLLVAAQDVLPPATLERYLLSGSGQLEMNFTLPTTVQYDVQACAVGNALPEAASVPIPSSVGSGRLLLAKNGSELDISTQGSILRPFDFWVELHQNYSYSTGPSTVISRDLAVAAITTVQMTAGANSTNATLIDRAQVRDGRFVVRAFFGTPSGIAVEQTEVLLSGNQTWISLPDCSSTAVVRATTFSLSASLADPVSRWPTAVYTMYESYGVEMVTLTMLDLQPAVVTVLASPWETPLNDSLISFTLGPGVADSSSGGATLYLVASQYPVRVEVSVGGQTQSASVEQPFSSTTVQVNSSKLSVATYLDGKPASGASITVDAGNATLARAVGGSGFSVFYLPEGSYTVQVTLGNSTRLESVLSQTGKASVMDVYFTSRPDQTDLYLLLAAAGLGAMMSALVWVKVYRDRG